MLGTVAGMGIAHCVFIGSRHAENFLDNVKYYRRCKGDEKITPNECPVTIAFDK